MQYGDTVYFHVSNEETMEESALFGEFVKSDREPTILMAYDVGTGHTKAVQNDHAGRHGGFWGFSLLFGLCISGFSAL